MATHSWDMRFGAACGADGTTRFRLWAPGAQAVELELEPGGSVAAVPVGDGWFAAGIACPAGTAYRFRLQDGLVFPDPASRAQRGGVHGWSIVVDPTAYVWRHDDWLGRPWREAVVYEAHVGVMGGFDGVRRDLARLAGLGITAIELMPIADFPGRHNWGYDGVLPFAPAGAYGSPGELKALIDAAHGLGVMVLLDVVYNHFGPDGNFLHSYAPQFFHKEIPTPWGLAIAFDNPTVADFFAQNALYWLIEYRFDGLRLDAVHAILPREALAALGQAIRVGVAPRRHVHLVLENERNDASVLGWAVGDHLVGAMGGDVGVAVRALVASPFGREAAPGLRSGGRGEAAGEGAATGAGDGLCGSALTRSADALRPLPEGEVKGGRSAADARPFDAQWNDDLHHCLHVLLTGESEAYYRDYIDAPAERLARCLGSGFAYQGEHSLNLGHSRGTPSGELPTTAFVAFVQNHDQIGNRALGERLTCLADPQALRAAIALVLLCPQIPMIFMGEEIGTRSPFLFFTDHNPELAEAVREGRRNEFRNFAAFHDAAQRAHIPDPNDKATFSACVPQPPGDGFDWAGFYRDLIAVRARHVIPRLDGARSIEARVIASAAVLASWRMADGAVLTIAANFGDAACAFDVSADAWVIAISTAAAATPGAATLGIGGALAGRTTIALLAGAPVAAQ
jgi:maltooligosyltrehalose trehalohydrolase